jgi:membrane protease subunit HflC
MSQRAALFSLIAIVLGFWLAANCLVVVNEFEQVVITEFGEPMGVARTTPGLVIVAPWDKVHRFSKQLLRWDSDRAQVPTKDKRFIWVDCTARWQIIDSLKFLRSVRDFEGAQTRLDDVIESTVRLTLSENNLIEAVRPDTRAVEMPGMDTETHDELVVRKGRLALHKEILERARKMTIAAYGIDIVDVRLKRINYIEAVQQNVFGRMIAERQKVAEQYRSEGAGKAAEIQGTMERKLAEIRSGAYRKSREIAGQGEAEATKIYAEAYNADPELYAFLATLEAYPQMLGAGRGKGTKTHVLLGTDAELLTYLKGSKLVK